MERFVKMVNDCNDHQLFLQNSPPQMFDRILNTSLGFLLLEIKSQTLSYVVTAMVRSSRPGVFCKKEVLTKFAKLIEKHLCQSLFLIKKLWQRCFPVNFAKVLRKTFFDRTPPAAASEWYDFTQLSMSVISVFDKNFVLHNMHCKL